MEQARWAKETLNLPQSCPNVAAQLLLGAPYVKQIIYAMQLKFFMRLGELPSSRYAAQALKEHESGRWESKYLTNLMNIQKELNMTSLPPGEDFVDPVLDDHFEKVMKAEVGNKTSMELEKKALRRMRRASAREGDDWNWINRVIMGASGIRYNKNSSTWRTECGVDVARNTDFHCIYECALTKNAREKTGVRMFFTSCATKGIKPREAFSRFVLGQDGGGKEIRLEDYRERGRALATILKASMKRYETE